MESMAPVMIEGVHVQTPSARGAATLYKFRGRNLVTKQKVDITLKGGEALDEAEDLDRGLDHQKRPAEAHRAGRDPARADLVADLEAGGKL